MNDHSSLDSANAQTLAQNSAPSNEAFNCNFADHSSKQSFRVLSQAVKISSINFAERSFFVSTEIQVVPICSGLTDIVLDVGNECILPNEEGFKGIGAITVNDINAAYTRNRFSVSFNAHSSDRSVLHVKNAFSQAYNNYPGDLIVHIPDECARHMIEQMVIRIAVDLMVVAPRQVSDFLEYIAFLGIIFSGNFNEVGAHLYTSRSSLFSSTKHWLPCIEISNQLAVWRFEFTVPNAMTVVGCGDLVDTIPCADDDSLRTFHYQLLVPTSAINIGFAIGQFQIYTQPDIPEIISFCLPGLMPLLKHTVSTLNRTFTFFEEILSCRFPYGFYRLVFVDQLPEDVTSFAGLSIFSLHMLYHKKIFDLVQVSRQHLAYAIAQQFFGCFVNPADFGELWLVKSLSRYINGLFVERFFGHSEHVFDTEKMLKAVCDYESKFGKVVISSPKTSSGAVANPLSHPQFNHVFGGSARPASSSTNAPNHPNDALYFDCSLPDTCSPMYADALYKKGHFIMIMLQKRLGKDQFLKVLHRILSVAMQYSQNLTKPIDWFHMIVSTDSFFRSITNVTGRELPSFIDQWIHSGGHVRFEINHTFNRKHNKLELEVKQSASSALGVHNYVGPLTLVIQELDGSFTHTVQVDATVSKHDIVCHSKGRKQKKKRIPLSTGEEVEVDLTQMDADSPVMWIRVDPEMMIPRQIVLNQQLHQWEYMLRYERDVIAQMHSIAMLRNFPVHQTQNVLMEALENEKFFHKVRRSAASCLVDVCNRLPEGLIGTQHPLIVYFQRLFGCKSAPSIPVPNNFVATAANLQHYFLMLELPLAIGRIRGQGGMNCPPQVLEFLLGLLKLNDNSTNRYSDDYYRGHLINALGNTLVLSEHETRYPDRISEEARSVLAEIVHALNMDTMKPSFGRIVTIHALYMIRHLQRLRHIPLDLDIFWKFALSRGVFSQVRRAALICIILSVQNARNTAFAEPMHRLIDEVVMGDSDPYIRQKVVEHLCQQPPFVGITDPAQSTVFTTNTVGLTGILWNAITNPLIESKIRASLVDLYYQMYGRESPIVLRSYNPNTQHVANTSQISSLSSATNGMLQNLGGGFPIAAGNSYSNGFGRFM